MEQENTPNDVSDNYITSLFTPPIDTSEVAITFNPRFNPSLKYSEDYLELRIGEEEGLYSDLTQVQHLLI